MEVRLSCEQVEIPYARMHLALCIISTPLIEKEKIADESGVWGDSLL